ncbi:hypothetical protein R69658_07274 [Paraburkholderia aspalathi]|uniref:Uncharacterized protein n=1 Tax=Paraburkholderia aspalathi TaxID=1324617 RepID=A0ABN7N6Z7_9BURK|nr:hypothetical protein [Paraburkholderia aspalathi]MBK3823599.1 hypothetical protein [Paraburkholderia aspalathi]MBK3835444.1 hypothetical protein [Paraburkholderia aspalathi]MBK3865204.1 hypothetical protein [Paraburkholderia aspalathi]CAE6853468.1 hypothetical protein R69658_07274 [Paraburkholderia aspalathi]
MLAAKKILYAVVDPAQIKSRHPLLFKKVFDLTFVLTQRLSTIANGDVKYFDTIDEAMCHGRFYDLVIMQSVGNFIIQYRFLDELDEFYKANRNFFILVFPLTPPVDEGDGGREFDNRMIVVNVVEWERLGCPGLDEARELTGSAPQNLRANRIVHDGSSPLPTHGFQETMPIVRTKRGRRFLDAAASGGLTLHIFPESIRNCSLYIWPEFQSNRLYEGLVNCDESLVSNPDQRRWIRLSIPSSTIWIFNSEPYRFNIPLRQCDAYFGPAAGFKYLDILAYNPSVEFLFYDQNEDSLDWIKALKFNWDGNNFEGYVDGQPNKLKSKFKYVNSSITQNQRLLLHSFGGEKGFKRLWNLFRLSNARFLKCDLFNSCDVRTLVSKTNAKHPFFYYSNIFSTNFTLTVFSREEAEEKYRRFKSIVKTKFPDVVMHGADIGGRWH